MAVCCVRPICWEVSFPEPHDQESDETYQDRFRASKSREGAPGQADDPVREGVLAFTRACHAAHTAEAGTHIPALFFNNS